MMNPAQLPKSSTSGPSLSMQALAKTLGSGSSRLDVDQDVMEKFKAAAMSITTLYRASRASSQKAYNNGYSAALEDLRSICADVARSDSGGGPGSNGVQVARILHWIDARLEAVRLESREDDEDDDSVQHPRAHQSSSNSSSGARHQSQTHTTNHSNVQTRAALTKGLSGSGSEVREKAKLKTRQSSSSPPPHTNLATVSDGNQLSQAPRESRPSIPATTPAPPPAPSAVAPIAVPRASSSSPSPAIAPRTQQQPRTRARASKEPSSTITIAAAVEHVPLMDSTPATLNVLPQSQSQPHPFRDPGSTVAAFAEENEGWTHDRNVNSLLGAKRRHATMALDAASPSPYAEFGLFDRPAVASITTSSSLSTSSNSAAGTPSSRRRFRERPSRSSFVGPLNLSNANAQLSGSSTADAMDVEDEQGGRERKRVTRR